MALFASTQEIVLRNLRSQLGWQLSELHHRLNKAIDRASQLYSDCAEIDRDVQAGDWSMFSDLVTTERQLKRQEDFIRSLNHRISHLEAQNRKVVSDLVDETEPYIPERDGPWTDYELPF